MAVNTYLLDFTISEELLKSAESQVDVQDMIESELKKHLNDLNRNSVINLSGDFLMLLTGPDGLLVSVKSYKEGVITINIEHFKSDQQDALLSLETLRRIQETVESALFCKKSHKLPAIKRAGNVDRYFLTADERILEYDIDKVVFEERSPYQKVQIVHSKTLGNLLVLDELQNMSESDLIYTETLMDRGVENYKDKEVLILGGGDGCLLWELLKENPKFVTMLELDEVVMKACAQHLRSACGNCLDQMEGPHYKIIVGDCFVTLQQLIDEGRKVDYVFGDLTDIPVDSLGEHDGASWDFVRKIVDMALRVLRPGGKYLTHGNGLSVPKSLQAYECMLKSLKVPVEYTKSHAFVPSFLEDWVFYKVTPTF